MKAAEASLLQLMKKAQQFIIPIYQRTYSWTEKESRQLWDDILRAGSDERIHDYFIGSIVYIEQGQSQVTVQSPLLVIDGQQRITTVTLLLEALACRLGDSEPVEGCSALKIRSYYLQNPLEQGESMFKLMLTQADKTSLNALVTQSALPDDHSVRISQNFELFSNLVDELDEQSVTYLWQGLTKLIVVDVSLTRGQDSPQLIFESMNSTGRELSQADLIRNYVLMGLDPDHQESLYKKHWRPMEVRFGQEAYGAYFDSFMRHYLTVKTGDIPNVKAVYEAFKAYSSTPEATAAGVDSLVEDIERYAHYYCAMAFAQEADSGLRDGFNDLKELRVDVAYPLLLELYADYSTDLLLRDDFLQILRLIESYVFRRAVCSIPTNSLNKTFATFSRGINKDHYLESVTAALLPMPSYRHFPGDDEFTRELITRDLYKFPRSIYFLRRLENFGRKEKVSVEEYTIEHIMPQNKDLSTAWKQSLGPDWKRIHDTKLHTLGNLTLTGYNSEYSDRPFQEKRDMKGGFRNSPLHLNEGLGQIEDWNEKAIDNRAERLAALAVETWALPTLSSAVLELYRTAATSQVGYTIEDHPYLVTAGAARTLFDAFRREILALDPCVTEEFFKNYIAYKAETNFVDIVPQSKRLRLILNMSFPQLSDPKQIARDVTNIGHLGNGDVEVVLDSQEELPYVVGLARQSLELQLSNPEIES